MDSAESLVELLDESLARIAEGESPSEIAARSPEYAEQLLPLLHVAQLLYHASSMTAREEAFDEGYARAMAALDAKLKHPSRPRVSPPSALDALKPLPDVDRVEQLADRILNLEEPWRSRFVSLVLVYGGETPPETSEALRSALANVLLDDRLYSLVAELLHMWCHDDGTAEA